MKIIVLCFYLCLTQRPNFIGIGVVYSAFIQSAVHLYSAFIQSAVHLYSAFIQSAVHLYSAFIQSAVHLYSAFIQSTVHLYSAFIQSAVQFMPLIHPFTHTLTHQRRLAAMQGTNQLVRSNWGLGVLLRDTSTRPGWDRTGNPPTARRQLLPPEPYRSHIGFCGTSQNPTISFESNMSARGLYFYSEKNI